MFMSSTYIHLETVKKTLLSKVEYIICLVRTTTNINLQPSRLEHCHDRYIKATGKNKD